MKRLQQRELLNYQDLSIAAPRLSQLPLVSLDKLQPRELVFSEVQSLLPLAQLVSLDKSQLPLPVAVFLEIIKLLTLLPCLEAIHLLQPRKKKTTL
jgi:hypothetical protein